LNLTSDQGKSGFRFKQCWKFTATGGWWNEELKYKSLPASDKSITGLHRIFEKTTNQAFSSITE